MLHYNLVVPLAGKGQRMIDGGYRFPKPLILAGDRNILEWGLQSVDKSNATLIFVVRRDHVHNWSIDKVLRKQFDGTCLDIKIVIAEDDTAGSVDSCYLAKEYIDNEMPLVVFTSDVAFSPVFYPMENTFDYDGYLLTFKANSNGYSYVQKGINGLVTRTAEKVVISEDANVGVYCFRSGSRFCRLAEATVSTPGEHYLAPIYNLLIAAGGRVGCESVSNMNIMGTPEELQFFEEVSFPYFLPRGIILCSDHSGYKVKEMAANLIKTRYKDLHHIDVGCHSEDDCDYSDYIDQAIKVRASYPGYMILGFCRSGQGVNICANKHPKIRSALVSTCDEVHLAIRHNAANFLAVPAGKVNEDELEEMIHCATWQMFEGGRHQNRLQKAKAF